jgi:hypothetical protein
MLSLSSMLAFIFGLSLSLLGGPTTLTAEAADSSLFLPRTELIMPASPVFDGFSRGVVAIRVMFDPDDPTIEWADLLRIEMTAADTLGFSFQNENIIDLDGPGPVPTSSTHPVVRGIEDLLREHGHQIRIRPIDRIRRADSEGAIVVPVNLRRE